MILGGSTNAVLHLTAIAHSVGIDLTLEDYQAVSDRIPFIADLKPSGKYVFHDVFKLGGIPSTSRLLLKREIALIAAPWNAEILAYLLKNNLIDGNNMTVSGRTLGENLDRWTHEHGELEFSRQDVIRPLEKPIKETGHLRSVALRRTVPAKTLMPLTISILRGNLAPGGAVAKITGKEGLGFTGKARAFDSEDDFVKAVESGSFKKGEKAVAVLRYLGPKGGPGASRLIPRFECAAACVAPR